MVCAPLRRTTTNGRRCSMPFTFAGTPRDDCIWSWGMEICPVEISDLDLGANPVNPGAGFVNVSSTSGGSTGAGHPRVVWEQCVPDYQTSWDLPALNYSKRWVGVLYRHIFLLTVCCAVRCGAGGSQCCAVLPLGLVKGMYLPLLLLIPQS